MKIDASKQIITGVLVGFGGILAKVIWDQYQDAQSQNKGGLI